MSNFIARLHIPVNLIIIIIIITFSHVQKKKEGGISDRHISLLCFFSLMKSEWLIWWPASARMHMKGVKCKLDENSFFSTQEICFLFLKFFLSS